MKKLFILACVLMLLQSCGKTENCQFTKLTKTSYILVDSSYKVMNSDIVEGCYSITKTFNDSTLNDKRHDFSIYIKTLPHEFHITDDGSKHIYTKADGFKLGNAMSGDTLILKYFPTDNTPSQTLPYGLEYKFYN